MPEFKKPKISIDWFTDEQIINNWMDCWYTVLHVPPHNNKEILSYFLRMIFAKFVFHKKVNYFDFLPFQRIVKWCHKINQMQDDFIETTNLILGVGLILCHKFLLPRTWYVKLRLCYLICDRLWCCTVEVWSTSSVILLGRYLVRYQDLYISRYAEGPYGGASTLNLGLKGLWRETMIYDLRWRDPWFGAKGIISNKRS